MADISTDLYRAFKAKGTLAKGTKAHREEVFIDDEGAGGIRPNMGYRTSDGTVRPGDITTQTVKGEVIVPAVGKNSKKGISVSKTCGGFGYKGWAYFLLPEGTQVPDGLDVVSSPSRNDAGHYSIRCRAPMQWDAYTGALDNMARNAIVKCVELGVSPLYQAAP